MLVRPPETAAPQSMTAMLPSIQLPPGTPAWVVAMMEEAFKIQNDADAYVAALRDWVEHGSASRFALSPDEVVRRSRPRPPEVAAAAAACFELGQHLHRLGHAADAIRWFKRHTASQPDNWTYRRQAWFFADPVLIGPTEGAEDEWPYDSDWLSDAGRWGRRTTTPSRTCSAAVRPRRERLGGRSPVTGRRPRRAGSGER